MDNHRYSLGLHDYSAATAATPIVNPGQERKDNAGVINIGTYGGTAGVSKSYFGEPFCETIVAGDITGDCNVNFVDLALMAAHWLENNNQ